MSPVKEFTITLVDIAETTLPTPPLGKCMLTTSFIVVSYSSTPTPVSVLTAYICIGLYGLYFATDIWSSVV